jgi:predicted membrane protein
MSNQFGLRNLLLTMALVAVGMLVVAYTIRNQGDYVAIAAITCLAMIVVTFLLHALVFALLLPFGVLGELARESSTPGQSPFSTDRLPDSLVVPSDVEPSR